LAENIIIDIKKVNAKFSAVKMQWGSYSITLSLTLALGGVVG
jgi:hypothetical protein